MIVSHIDPDSLSTIAAADGFHALGRGDTVLAREKFAEAGKILEDGAARTESAPEKNLLRFLAASQYYHGGDYQRANRLVQRTKPKYLSKYDQEKFEAFRKDVEERADPGYPKRIRSAVFDAWTQGRWDAAIKLLQDHPFVVERSIMAWTRADLCFMKGLLKAAALFSADAVRFAQYGPRAVYLRAAGALRFYEPARHQTANEYSDLLLTQNPTALDYVTACVFRFDRLKGGDRSSGEELLRLFAQAEAAFERLPAATRSDVAVRGYMAHGYLLAALTLDGFGETHQAVLLAEAGVKLGPFAQFAHVYKALLDQSGGGYNRWANEVSVAPLSLLEHQQARQTEVEEALRTAA